MRCGKIIYPNATVAHQYMLKEKKEGNKMNYYFCELCEGYHLTRMPKKAQEDFKKSVLNAHKLKKKKLKEIELGPFANVHDNWKELQKLQSDITKTNKEIEEKVKEMLR